MEIVVHRDRPLASEARHLPATVYNLAHGLLARHRGAVFVPIRSMQFLAIVDAEEIVFVDHLRKTEAVIVWRAFRPQARTRLDEAVPYECCLHHADARATMPRLQGEFAKALQELAAKDTPSSPASLLQFSRPPKTPAAGP